jgi:protein ImuA
MGLSYRQTPMSKTKLISINIAKYYSIARLFMTPTKEHIIAQLQKEILPLQGLQHRSADAALRMHLGPMKYAFPNWQFPLAAVHELISNDKERSTVSAGFISPIIAALMCNSGATIWISASRNIFPPALQSFGISPDRIIFIDLKKDKDVLWATEEALKCGGLAAVVSELPELSFTASRRLQLAVEQSRVTGFILRNKPKQLGTTACVTRWQISSMPSSTIDDLPGIGFPRWNVDLLKVRNGKPGSWQIEWNGKDFNHIIPDISITEQLQQKTG